jgi:hypothetical protein
MSTVPFSKRSSTPEIERPLPHYLVAEKTLLGVLLLSGSEGQNPKLAAIRAKISTDDFFLTEHKKIFAAMLALDDCATGIDAVTLTNKLHALGQLDAAGGPAYISQLSDNVPAAMNVAHYAEIIAEKAQMRRVINAAQSLQDLAFDPAMRAAELIERVDEQLTSIRRPRTDNPAKVIGLRELLTMEMPPLEYVFEPLLTVGGTGEIYGWRGTGKSLITTWMSLRISSGSALLFPNPHAGGNWPIRRRSRVLYVYGEMHGQMIKQRAWQIARGEGLDRLPEDEWFGVMCKDFQKSWRPNISTPQNRKIIEDRIQSGGYRVVVLDNISTLWPSSQEGEGERSATLTDWYNDLNQDGISVIFLHHAGKGGTQRGSSEKEDMLDFVLRLQRPSNRKNDPQLCVEVAQEKCRSECKEARWLKPFELALETRDDIAQWTIRPARHAQIEAAFEMFRDGMKPGDAFAELGIARSTAYRYKKYYDQNQDPQHWTEQE